MLGWSIHAPSGTHRFPLQRQDNLVPVDDQHPGRPKGKGDVNIGISKVPDSRLDVLTAMYNPRKRVPATVEFTDIIAPTRAAQALVDVAGYKNGDASCTSCMRFAIRACRIHPARSIPRATRRRWKTS